MSAKELRRAAETLRERALAVVAHSPSSADGGWFEADVDLRNAIKGTFLGNAKSAPDDARWIATMHPGVGLALADLLDAAAEGLLATDYGRALTDVESRALRLAHLVSGGAS